MVRHKVQRLPSISLNAHGPQGRLGYSRQGGCHITSHFGGDRGSGVPRRTAISLGGCKGPHTRSVSPAHVSKAVCSGSSCAGCHRLLSGGCPTGPATEPRPWPPTVFQALAPRRPRRTQLLTARPYAYSSCAWEMVARGNADKQGCLNFTRVEERQLERGRVPSARACLAALSRRTLCVAPTGAHPRVQLHEPEAVAGRRGQGSGVVCLRQKRFPHHDFQPRPLPGSGASPVGAFRGTASGGGRPMIF